MSTSHLVIWILPLGPVPITVVQTEHCTNMSYLKEHNSHSWHQEIIMTTFLHMAIISTCKKNQCYYSHFLTHGSKVSWRKGCHFFNVHKGTPWATGSLYPVEWSEPLTHSGGNSSLDSPGLSKNMRQRESSLLPLFTSQEYSPTFLLFLRELGRLSILCNHVCLNQLYRR